MGGGGERSKLVWNSEIICLGSIKGKWRVACFNKPSKIRLSFYSIFFHNRTGKLFLFFMVLARSATLMLFNLKENACTIGTNKAINMSKPRACCYRSPSLWYPMLTKSFLCVSVANSSQCWDQPSINALEKKVLLRCWITEIKYWSRLIQIYNINVLKGGLLKIQN